MARSIAESLKKAFAEKGIELPSARNKAKHTNDVKAPSKAGLPLPQTTKSQSLTQPQVKAHAVSKKNGKRSSQGQKQSSSAPPSMAPNWDFSCYESKKKVVTVSQDALEIQLEIHSDARLALDSNVADEAVLLTEFIQAGHQTQCGSPGNLSEEREIVLGLDFGTSSVKVVVGDRALNKAFAVPFRSASDIAHFLLPTRLYEAPEKYSLSEGTTCHQDLKLSLIAHPQDTQLQERVAAFLALVIQHVRGWLFTEHKDIYQNKRLFWRLAIGLPVAHHLDDDLYQTFQISAHMAWLVAANRVIDAHSIAHAKERWATLKANPELASIDEDVEVTVVPEIAAQIYGFVNSSRFNRNAPNIYLMVDVGAGSVDSSLFHVKPSKGKWDFEFFTSVVEPHGVMNLHRHRVDWWKSQLTEHPQGQVLAGAIEAVKFATDRTTALPEHFTDYIKGVSVKVSKDKNNPDKEFFQYRVVKQVRGESYWRAWNRGLLSQAQLVDVPSFYCGGGMRMSFYNQLKNEMQTFPGFTWLKAKPRPIEIPENLEAPGLKRSEYDRLTVAYGLSFLDAGKVIKSLPTPKLLSPPTSAWQANYIDKSCC